MCLILCLFLVSDIYFVSGSGCSINCPWLNQVAQPIQFVNQTSGVCQSCVIPSCKLGQGAIGCARDAQSYCLNCSSLPIGMAYIIPGDCRMEHTRFLPPCPIGYYPTGW